MLGALGQIQEGCLYPEEIKCEHHQEKSETLSKHVILSGNMSITSTQTLDLRTHHIELMDFTLITFNARPRRVHLINNPRDNYEDLFAEELRPLLRDAPLQWHAVVHVRKRSAKDVDEDAEVEGNSAVELEKQRREVWRASQFSKSAWKGFTSQKPAIGKQ